MSKIDGGHLIAEMLAREGVRYVFSVSGGVLNPLYNACPDAGIQIVHTRHEAAATYMADAWARTTGQPGVCAVTLGPGATNTMTGIMTAYRGVSPILVLAGQSGQTTRDLEPGMSIDPLPMMYPITKWARTVPSAARIPEYIAAAYRHATTGRPGPVFLEFPSEVLHDAVNRDVDYPLPETSRSSARPYPDTKLMAMAVSLLEKSERPIVLAGSGVWWSGASAALRSLVEKASLPFFLARGARGAVSEDHPLYFGPAYLPANPVLEAAFHSCDLVLTLGHRLDFDLGFGRPPSLASSARVIQVDIEAAEMGRYRPVDVGLVADARVAIEALARSIGSKKTPSDWLSTLETARGQWLAEMTAATSLEGNPMHPLRFVKEIAAGLPREAILVTGHGNVDFWADEYLRVFYPGHYLRAGQSGVMGAEIPYGVAAKLAHPDQPVVVMVGDGAFAYHCMELDTAARYNAPLVIAIGNDSCWGAIALPQERIYGRRVELDLPFRNYERIADIFGGQGELVKLPEEVTPALRRALESRKPSVLNVLIKSVESRYIHEISR